MNADFFAKDLRMLTGNNSGRDLKNIIVVDNLISNFIYQTDHCVPIKDYNGEVDDNTLQSLTKYLMSLYRIENVTEKIAEDFFNPLFKYKMRSDLIGI